MVQSSYSSTYVDIPEGGKNADSPEIISLDASMFRSQAAEAKVSEEAGLPESAAADPAGKQKEQEDDEEAVIEETHSDEEIQYGLSHFGETVSLGDSFHFSGCSAHTADTLPMVPNIFAVVCAMNEEGERAYPWGVVSIQDERFSDFRRLQRLVVESDNVTEMINVTQQVSIRLAAASPSRKTSARGAWLSLCVPSGLVVRGGVPTPRSSAVTAAAPTGGARRLNDRQRKVLRCVVDVLLLVGLVLVVVSAACQIRKLLLVPVPVGSST